MKNIKKFLFLLIIVLVCPMFVMACGEEKYEDIPFTSSSMSAQAVITNVDNARTLMITGLELRAKIETVNTYKFTKTQNSDDIAENKTIKDVITTTVGNSKSNPAVSSVERVRYINDKKCFRELKTYVRQTESGNSGYISFCYTLTETYNDDGTVVIKNREEYDSGYYDFLKLFNDAIVSANADEINTVTQKSFQGTTYYHLESQLSGYEVVSDRFVKKANIYSNPELFASLAPEYDAPMPFMYEYGINGSGYISYARVKYDIVNSDREKYLSVDSVSRVVSYGDSLSPLSKPSNVDDYTAETFVSILNNNQSYIVYRKNGEEANEHIDTTVIKIGNTNPNYSVKVEKYSTGTVTSTTYYYVKYDETSSTKYKSYVLTDYPTQLKYEESDYVLDLVDYNFNVSYNKENSQNGVYHFGDSTTYIKVSLTDNEISKISTMKGEITLELNIQGYGKDVEPLHMPTSLNGFTFVEPEPDSGEGEGA